MAEKKITVLGDAGDDSLSPEDEHKIEVKIDRMLSLDDDQAKVADPETPTAPPAADAVMSGEAMETPEPAGPPPLSKKVKKINIFHADDEAEAAELEIPLAEPLPEAAPPPEPQAEPEPEPVLASEPETVPEPEIEPAKPAPLEPSSDDAKKYRPPDGPRPFKRAESSPSEALAPEAAASASLTAEEQEDAAIAAAFAAKEPKASEKVSRRPHRSHRRKLVILLVVFIIVVGGAVAVVAVPSLRHRLTNTADKSSTPTKMATAPATTTQKVTPTATAPLPDIFLAKRDGIYNLYKVDQSGQNKQQLLAGSGYETSATTQLLANSTATLAALVSLRDNSKDNAGYPLQTLSLVDVTTASATKITQAQRVQLLGWYGSKLVYVASKTGATSVSDPNSYQLMAYDSASKQSQVLDHAAHFNAVLAVHDELFYATDGNTAAVYRIKPDGSGKQTVLSKLVTNLYRTGYNSLAFASASGWYTLDVTTPNAKPLSTVNAYTGTNKLYIDSPDQRYSLHVEIQNGAATLLLYNAATKKDTVLTQPAGLTYPLHWLSNSVAVYRIDTDTQTADYTVNVATNATAKLVDTSSFRGLEP